MKHVYQVIVNIVGKQFFSVHSVHIHKELSRWGNAITAQKIY